MLKSDRRSFLPPLQDIQDLHGPASAQGGPSQGDQFVFIGHAETNYAVSLPPGSADGTLLADTEMSTLDAESAGGSALLDSSATHIPAASTAGPATFSPNVAHDVPAVPLPASARFQAITAGEPDGADAAPSQPPALAPEDIVLSWRQDFAWFGDDMHAYVAVSVDIRMSSMPDAGDPDMVSLLNAGGGDAGSASLASSGIPIAYAVNSTYDIEINFSGDARFRPAFDAAIARWEQIIIGDLSDVNSGTYGFIDDLLIDASVTYIDGAGNILGQAGPDAIRSGGLTYHGVMEFDSADADAMLANGTFTDVVLHEMGHVLGIGTLWSSKGLASGFNYTGTQALAEYRILTGNSSLTSIPLENQGGSGTAGGHWRETTFDRELMTGYIEAPGVTMPISRMTVASLADLGYSVNMAAANGYSLPGTVTDDYLATTATNGAVAVNSYATGAINTNGDHDWFRVSLVAGRLYTVDLAASGAGLGTLSNAYLNVRNSAGTIVTSDNDSGPGNDSRVSFAASYTGNYFIDAGSYNDTGTGTYRVAIAANSPPVAAIGDQHLGNRWAQVSNWLSYSDANGDVATHYQFQDGGSSATSGYFANASNWHYDANIPITIAASDISGMYVHGGATAGTETMYVRAYDGTDWGDWDTFILTSLGNSRPVATINDQSIATGGSASVAPWLSYSDTDGDPAAYYQFHDGGYGTSSAYFYNSANAHYAAGVDIMVAASDVANMYVRGGATYGTETLYVRAYDGTAWGEWDSFNFTTRGNAPPVAMINDHAVLTNQSASVAPWLSYSDADGNPAAYYQFHDGGSGTNSGYFYNSANAHYAAGLDIMVAASDVANMYVRGAATAGSESMYVRAYDGTSWGEWDQFNLTSVANAAPVAAIVNQDLHINQWSNVSNWLQYSDANGNPAVQYQFYDDGAGANSAYFANAANWHQPSGSTITIAAADLPAFYVSGGAVIGSDSMYVRAFDGTDWGNWDQFYLNTVA